MRPNLAEITGVSQIRADRSVLPGPRKDVCNKQIIYAGDVTQ